MADVLPPEVPLTADDFFGALAWLARNDGDGARSSEVQAVRAVVEAWLAQESAADAAAGPLDPDTEAQLARMKARAAVKPPILSRARGSRPAPATAAATSPERQGNRGLLDDTLAVLRSRARWPQALAPGYLQRSTVHWARFHAEVVFADAPPAWRAACKQWAECWPLPVGRAALRATLEADLDLAMSLGDEAAWALQASLPFTHHEYAALVLHAPHSPGARLTAYILAEPQDPDAGFGDLLWTAGGATEIPEHLHKFLVAAKYFLAHFRGRPLPGSAAAGAPPVLQDTLDELADRLELYFRAHHRDTGRWPSCDLSAGKLGIGRTTLWSFLHDRHTDWPTLKRQLIEQASRPARKN